MRIRNGLIWRNLWLRGSRKRNSRQIRHWIIGLYFMSFGRLSTYVFLFLRRNVKKGKGREKRFHKCELCGKSCKNASGLGSHMRIHPRCPECNKHFVSSSEMEAHRGRKHGKPSAKRQRLNDDGEYKVPGCYQQQTKSVQPRDKNPRRAARDKRKPYYWST